MRSDTHEAEDDAYPIQYTKDSPGMGELTGVGKGRLFLENVQMAESAGRDEHSREDREVVGCVHNCGTCDRVKPNANVT